MPELDGQVALVTGGGRGIGANVARELAAAGARVAVSGRSRDEVEAVAQEIGGLAVVADVTKGEDVAAMVAQVERELGPIDLLCANAGTGDRSSTWEGDLASIRYSPGALPLELSGAILAAAGKTRFPQPAAFSPANQGARDGSMAGARYGGVAERRR